MKRSAPTKSKQEAGGGNKIAVEDLEQRDQGNGKDEPDQPDLEWVACSNAMAVANAVSKQALPRRDVGTAPTAHT